jgi:hypothetical protein
MAYEWRRIISIWVEVSEIVWGFEGGSKAASECSYYSRLWSDFLDLL